MNVVWGAWRRGEVGNRVPARQGNIRVAHHDSVAAVVVAVGADASLLTATLAGLAAQSVVPDRILVAVPTAQAAEKAIENAALPAQFLARCVIIPVGSTRTFGDAVALARKRDNDEHRDLTSAQENQSAQTIAQGAEKTQWLWLLHADSTPLPSALENLLAAGEKSAKIGVVGPKYVAVRSAPSDPYYVREVGIRATRSARRVPETREVERDQGQFDTREDVLAVGSAGMLVRTNVWEQLGGFNPNLGPFGDGLEFSRRVHLAGYRVVVAPRALVEHHGHSLRPDSDLALSYGARRRAQIFNALLAAPRLLVVPLWLGYVLGGLPRALVRLMWRDFVRARGELSASVRTLGALGAVLNGRKAIALTGGQQSSLRALEASSRDIREAKKALRIAEEDEAAEVPDVDPLDLKAAREARVRTGKGALVAVLVAAAFAAILNVKNFAAGTLIGGALAPDKLTAAGLWQTAIHDWLASADGVAGTIDLYWLAWLPALAVGAPWGLTLGALLTAWVYVAPVLAVLTAYLAVGRLTRIASMRVVLALLWVVSPSFLEALAQGRVAALSVHVLIPLALFAVVGAWREKFGYEETVHSRMKRRRAGRHSSQAHIHIGLSSLVFALLALAAPIFALLAALLALICALCARSGRLRWLWVPVPAIAVSIPAMVHLRLNWQAWLAFFMSTPGVPVSGIAAPRQILTGFTTRAFHVTAPSLDWLLFIPLMVVVAVAALMALYPRSGGATKLGWLLVAAGMALAVCSPFVPVGAAVEAGQFVPVAAWHGVGFSLAWLGIITAIARGSARMRPVAAPQTDLASSTDDSQTSSSAVNSLQMRNLHLGGAQTDDLQTSDSHTALGAHSASNEHLTADSPAHQDSDGWRSPEREVSQESEDPDESADSAQLTQESAEPIEEPREESAQLPEDLAEPIEESAATEPADSAADVPDSTVTSGRKRAGARRAAYSALATLLCVSALVIGGWWAGSEAISASGELRGEPAALAPALAVTNQTSHERSRLVALHATANGMEVEIWRGQGVQLHEYTMAREANRASSLYPIGARWQVDPDEQAAASFDLAQENLSAALANVPAAGQDVANVLAEHAISVVLVVPQRELTDSQARSQLIADLNAVPGLEYVTQNETGTFWRVNASRAASATQTPARVQVVDSESGLWQALDSDVWDAQAFLDAAAGARTLVLAERANNGWKAALDGAALAPLDERAKARAGVPVWANAWTIPAGAGGEIAIWRRDWFLWGALSFAALALLAGIAASVPLRPRKEDVA